MGGIFDRIRSGAGRAAFEADRQRRILALQSTIRGDKREIERALKAAGVAAMRLFHNGGLTEPELQQVCQEVARLQAQLVAHEQEVESIRQEVFVPPVPAQESALYGDVCPNGHGAVPEGAKFCPECGAAVIHRAPPEPGSACVSCNAPLVPGARFCPECGAAQPAPSTRACAQCGTPVPSEAVFCGECGHPVEPPTPAAPEPAFPAPPPSMPEPVPHAAATPAPEAAPPAPPRASEGLEELEWEAEQEVLPERDAAADQCPNCGAALVPGAAFCGECGHTLDQVPEPPPPPEGLQEVEWEPEQDALAPSEPNVAVSPIPLPDPSEVDKPVSPSSLPAELQELEWQPEEDALVPSEPEVGASPIPLPDPPEPASPSSLPAELQELEWEPEQDALTRRAPDAAAGLCPNCGAAWMPGAAFCGECGHSMAQAAEAAPPVAPVADAGRCPHCGTELVPEAVFCPECGQPVGDR